jgi:hypothetical protein
MNWSAVILLSLVSSVAAASDLGAPLGSSTGGSLYNPTINVIGQTSWTHVTTIKPGGELTGGGPLSAVPSRAGGSDSLLIEQRLDCFADSLPPDRDVRNRFLTRCPGNF